MSDALRRQRYRGSRVLIDTERVLDPQFKPTLLCVTGAQVEMLRNLMAYLNRTTTFVSEYNTDYYLTPTVSEWDSLQSIVASLEDMLMEVVLGFYDAYICVWDQKAQGVHGGTFASGAWRTRDINVKHADTAGICEIDGNQITLDAGTYRTLISCPARHCQNTQARLYSVTDTEVLLLSQSAYFFEPNEQDISIIAGRFTLAAEEVLEVQHQCLTTKTVSGFGYAANFTDEKYTVAEFWREV